MQPAVIYETGGREDGLNGSIWSTITRVGTKWSRPCWVRTSRGCWAATSTPPTIVIRDCIGEASYISYAMGMTSKNSMPTTQQGLAWFTAVKALYERACAYVGPQGNRL
jgi:hypothetical protein